MTTPLLELQAMVKRYGEFTALDHVDLQLMPGEVHVLFGENGAGKSTLISLVAGAQQPSAGRMLLRGLPVRFGSVRDARRMGVSAVFQEFSLVPTLTVAQNLFLGDEPHRGLWLLRGELRRRARALLAHLGFDIDPDAPVSRLSRAQQQMVEIAKAVHSAGGAGAATHGLSVLILDEPTASLTDRETERLFELIGRLRAAGTGILYITHRMQEIARIADRITVLRDGRRVATIDAAQSTHDLLVEMMSGRAMSDIYPRIETTRGELLLSVRDLSTASGVRNASIDVHRGEVVGLAGLVGAGKSELMRAVFGIEPITGGTIRYKGRPLSAPDPARLMRDGFVYLPPDRKHEGLVLEFAARENIVLSAATGRRLRNRLGLLSPSRAQALATQTARQVELAAANVDKPVVQLSGGNQQKVLFAKALTEPRDLYVFDEPTVGVDVGTRRALYAVIARLCEAGAAVVVISSDLPEVLHLSQRLYVMTAGRVAAELSGEAINESDVLRHFFPQDKAAA